MKIVLARTVLAAGAGFFAEWVAEGLTTRWIAVVVGAIIFLVIAGWGLKAIQADDPSADRE